METVWSKGVNVDIVAGSDIAQPRCIFDLVSACNTALGLSMVLVGVFTLVKLTVGQDFILSPGDEKRNDVARKCRNHTELASLLVACRPPDNEIMPKS